MKKIRVFTSDTFFNHGNDPYYSREIWNDTRLKFTDVAVLLALWSKFDENSTEYIDIPMEELLSESEEDKKYVNDGIKALVDSGYIQLINGGE